MNRVYLTGLALGVLITGYVVLDRSAQEPSIIKTDYAAESNIPSTEKSPLNKLNTNTNTNTDNTQTSQTDPSPRETEAQEINLAYQYQEAVREFEVLTPSEQLQKRKLSLSKVIAGEKISITHEIALQQDWERMGAAEPGYQHNKEVTTVNVNGIDIDHGQPGVIVADQVMVYVPKSKRGLLSELSSVSGIDRIEPVFSGAKATTISGQRDLSGWQRISLKVPVDRINAIVSALKSFDGVIEAEPVYERKISTIPPLIQDLDDPMMSDQWHLDAANVKSAWDYLEANDLPAGGDDSIVVAVIDSGVDYDHPDLSANMWVNTQEIPGNGVDDDNNGFIDDIHGVSVVSENFSHTGDPDDDNGHGTHVAGIIASSGGNGLGGVGVAYNSKIMAIKAAQYSGVLTTTDIAEAIYYAIDNGADVINMSFGGYGRSQIEQDALAAAYSQAVLIAAAGNDGNFNQPCPIGAPMYPAAHPWVVGVMAGTPWEGQMRLASFSNKECVNKNGVEYEVLAPGTGVWSTLPDNSYSAWSGTSMAAPVVAGISALVRTKWPDKSVYSSRFIMGQLVATNGDPRGKRGVDANAYKAISTVPKPDLSYEEHWIFDPLDNSASNDNDGRLDAGETIELALTIRNRWGRGDNVVATLSTPSGAASADPYVTFETDTVNYGAVGSFNKDDNGIIYDENLLVIGVANPFVFSIDENTPNNHVVPFTLTIEASNGLEPEDSERYSFTSQFSVVVQRGRELPSIIDSDAIGSAGGSLDTDGVENGVVTLDSSALWIVDKPVLVAKGATLSISEEAQVQFWSSAPDATQTQWRPAFLRVEGTLSVNGSADKPVEIFPSSLFPSRAINIFKGNSEAAINVSYANIANIFAFEDYDYIPTRVPWDNVTYNYFYRVMQNRYLCHPLTTATSPSYSDLRCYLQHPKLPEVLSKSGEIGVASGNRFYRLALETGSDPGIRMPSHYSGSLFDNMGFSFQDTGGKGSGNVFLINNQTYVTSSGNTIVEKASIGPPDAAFDYALYEPFYYDGKTYAIAYVENRSRDLSNNAAVNLSWGYEKIEKAQVIARHFGGSLMTPSNAEEIEVVSSWMLNVSQQPQAYWESKYSTCEPVSLDQSPFCSTYVGQGHYTIGLIRQVNGTYEWDGDDAGYGETFLNLLGNSDEEWYSYGALMSGSGLSSMNFSQYAGGERTNDLYPYLYSRIIIEIPGELTQSDLDSGISNLKEEGGNNKFKGNAMLNPWRNLNAATWGEITSVAGDSSRRWDPVIDISNNFWGGAGEDLIEESISDFNDTFNKAKIKYKPILSSAPETMYPFVTSVDILNGNGVKPSGNKFGVESSTWQISFNKNMDVTKQPLVTFGPDEPYTDFSVPGQWIDAKTWEGSFAFNSITGDGYQKIYVVGAVAAENSRLVSGHDVGRFQFELITSGVEALTLQAAGLTGQVSLEWMQDDFELLHGYNLYRSMSEDGSYSRINSSTINKTITEYIDSDITPGVPHYYYFTVVSDSGESDPSNIAMATPVDTVDPVITHKTEAVVSLNDSLTLRATVTDNIAVSRVNIVFRNASSSTWQTRAMVLTDPDSNRYSVTIGAPDIGNQYLKYYIEAKDAVNTVTSGSAESPFKVFVSLPSDTDTDGDGVNNADDAFPYDPSETTDLDGDGIGDNADLDDDGDNYNDDVDVFPRDASEWIDTDGDGIGNNKDSDDDNDGVEDGADQFPLDARGSKDSDNDGMPDQWETDNGLDPNDASDAESDADFDGFTALQEFEADTSPLVSDQNTQIIYHEFSPFVAGFSNNVKVFYRPSDGVSGLIGLGLRVHYNSRLVEPLVIENILLLDLVSLGTAAMPDTADFDNDPSTDSFINIAWAATSGSSWPGESPVKLFDMKVKFSDSVTADSTINIKFTSSSTHSGYGFSSVPIKTSVNLNSLDIDGTGNPDALSDGLLILRSLFGLTDGALIQNVVATDATFSSASEIQSRINNLGEFLDIDGNAVVDPLSDGLLILRYMFGIRGADLINGVVAPDATRTTADQVEAYLAKMIPSI